MTGGWLLSVHLSDGGRMTHNPMFATKFPKFLIGRPVWAAVALAVLGAGAYAGWRHWQGQRADLSQYQLAKVQRADIEDLVTATGSLQPREYVDVGAQVSGQLRKIHVEIGSVVQAGDLLAEIDPTVYRANVDARRAQLRNLRATLVERESQLLLAQQQQTRQQGLIAGDATTQEAVQQADAAVRSARAQIEALQAQIEQSESTLRADEANLNYANIYSPMAGVVVSITARQGQTINATQQAPIILRVADLSSMTVQTQVSEADIGQLRPDMDAYFTTLGNRGRRWWGKLRKVEPTPTVTNNVVLYNALFDVVNDQRNLLPQMTAQVFFVAAKAENVLVVPASAVTVQRGAREEGKRPGEAQVAPSRAVSGAASGAASGAVPGGRKPPRRESEGTLGRQPEDRHKRQIKGEAAPRTPTAVWAGVGSGRAARPKDASVKVVTEAGEIEERQVRIGISNRVQVEILQGLKEGEQVVAGFKPPPVQARAEGGNRHALQGQGGNVPGGPGGVGAAAGGRGR